MSEDVIMPKRLTSENGAKCLLIGEFFEDLVVPCPECNDDSDGNYCGMCDNCGAITIKVPVQWTTIKDIYAKAVDALGREL